MLKSPKLLVPYKSQVFNSMYQKDMTMNGVCVEMAKMKISLVSRTQNIQKKESGIGKF